MRCSLDDRKIFGDHFMNSQSRKSALLLLIIAMAVATAACNTTKGLGKDVEKVGEEIQEEAEQHD